MRRNNILLATLAISVGVIIGALITNPGSQGSYIAKLRGQNNISTVSAGVNEPPQTPPAQEAGQNEPPEAGVFQDGADQDAALALEELQIIADYKQDIGIFFGAWKSTDIDAFRQKLEKAYVGDLLERHIRQAQEFLVQGVGLEATEISFDQVDVEAADANTATLWVKYRYKARDYSLADGATFGEEHEQVVKIRVNMLKQNSRWLITGETLID